MAGKQIISSEGVLAAGDALGAGTELKLSSVQRAGLWLAAGVGAIIAAVTLFILIFVYRHYPTMPTANLTNAPTPQIIEQYKELSQIAIKGGQDLFQTIVTQALLPVLTAILGYIFGKGERVG